MELAEHTNEFVKPSAALGTLTKARFRDVIEFYFRDNRISSLYDGVPISRMLKFRKVRSKLGLNGVHAVSLDLLVEALLESRVLEVSEDRLNIRRIKSFSGEGMDKGIDEHTIVAQGFSKHVSLGDVIAFFGQVGEVRTATWVRSPNDPQFRGHVLVEFVSPQSACEVVTSKKVQFQDREVVVNYRRVDPLGIRPAKQILEPSFAADRVIKFQNVDPSTPHATIKHVFEVKGPTRVDFVDYRRDETYGFIRLADESAKGLCSQMNGRVVIGGETVIVRALEGKEEKDYWAIVFQGSVGNVRLYRHKAAKASSSIRSHPYVSRKQQLPLRTEDASGEGKHAGRVGPDRSRKQKRVKKKNKKEPVKVPKSEVEMVQDLFVKMNVDETMNNGYEKEGMDTGGETPI